MMQSLYHSEFLVLFLSDVIFDIGVLNFNGRLLT